jgi:hypothetical protein
MVSVLRSEGPLVASDQLLLTSHREVGKPRVQYLLDKVKQNSLLALDLPRICWLTRSQTTALAAAVDQLVQQKALCLRQKLRRFHIAQRRRIVAQRRLKNEHWCSAQCERFAFPTSTAIAHRQYVAL